jgi:hypothetical protein
MIAMTAMIFTTRFNWTVKGLGGRRACRVSAAMPAIVVRAPVALTTPSPSPCTTNVPAIANSPAAC